MDKQTIWSKKELEKKKKKTNLSYLEKRTSQTKYDKVIKPFTI